MRTPSTLDRATDQLVDGAAETADLVVDALADMAHSAVDVAADVTLTGVVRRLKEPRSLLALLVVALLGVWLYRRLGEGDNSGDDRSR